MNTSRRKLDRALIALIFTLLITAIVAITVIKMDCTEIAVPPTTTVDILEEKAEPLPAVCDFGGCPVAKPVTTEPETTELIFTEALTDLVTEPEEELLTYYEDTFYGSEEVYSPEYFAQAGLIDFDGWTWSWYSERVLPGTGLDIPGRYTCHKGFVRDWESYICLASDVLPYGTVVWTPFGSYGKVYDCGVGHDDWIDVYVGW